MPATRPVERVAPPSAGPRAAAAGLAAAAVGVAVLAGCTDGGSPRPDQSPSPTPAPDPDLRLLEDALAEEDALLALYAGLLPRVGGAVRVALAALSGHHVEHRSELAAAIAARRPGSPSPTAGESTSSPPPGAASSPAAAPAAAVRPEQASAQRILVAVRSAVDPAVALLLAETAASHAQHAIALRGVR